MLHPCGNIIHIGIQVISINFISQLLPQKKLAASCPPESCVRYLGEPRESQGGRRKVKNSKLLCRLGFAAGLLVSHRHPRSGSHIQRFELRLALYSLKKNSLVIMTFITKLKRYCIWSYMWGWPKICGLKRIFIFQHNGWFSEKPTRSLNYWVAGL